MLLNCKFDLLAKKRKLKTTTVKFCEPHGISSAREYFNLSLKLKQYLEVDFCLKE